MSSQILFTELSYFPKRQLMDSSQQLQIGQQLGGCRILRKLGEGGMGEVYEAWEESSNRRVAIKILARGSLASADLVTRFRNEGLTLSKVSHPNVVSLYAIGEIDGREYMTMEYVDGVAVSAFFDTYTCSLKSTLEMFIQMAEGLACAHEAKIIHRDIKPGNIIIDQSMNCKIIDFGIAKVNSDQSPDSKTAKDIVMGTVNFLSPEVVMGRASTALSDIYSLGLVFYHVLTGEIPFAGQSSLEILEKIRSSPLALDPRFNVLFPEDLRQIVFRMTAKSPSMRYQSAREVAEELRRVDFSQWPDDLLVPHSPQCKISNRDEIYTFCHAQGYALPEMRLIVNLASIFVDSSTEDVFIDPATIALAIARFKAAKEQLESKRAENTRRLQTQPRAGSRPKMMWSALGAFLLICTAYFTNVREYAPMDGEIMDMSSRRGMHVPEKPHFKPGDQFHIRVSLFEATGMSRKYTENWTVVNVQPGRVDLSNNGHGEMTLSDDFYLPALRLSGVAETSDLESHRAASSPSLFTVPIGTETMDKVEMTLTESKRHWEFIWQCHMQIAPPTPWKQDMLKTYRIICSSEDGPILSDSYLYAPALHFWLSRDLLLRDGLTHAHYELIGNELAH